MITVSDVSLSFGGQMLFKDVNLLFTAGNCYGVIGANGAGKSTFLKILCGALEPTTGTVTVQEGLRMSVLKQDHYAYDEYTVQDTVIMGNPRLYEVMKQKDALYAKEDFTEEDGNLASELEGEFAELGGWEAESDASKLVQGLGLDESIMYAQMSSLAGNEKVKVLLAQALFGNPDIILMDEPTNGLDIPSKSQFRKVVANNMSDDRTMIISTHQVHDVESLLDHIMILDHSELLLNESVADIRSKYSFEFRSMGEPANDVIYAEPSLQGNAVITRRREDEDETQLNLELLFNAVTKKLLPRE